MHEYSFDGAVAIETVTCQRCGASHLVSTGWVLDHGDAHAVYYADTHPATSEVFVEVIIDTSWDTPSTHRVVFACRFGPIEGSAPASSIMTPLRPQTDFSGRALDRGEALAHPWIDDFWEVCDWILYNDPVSHPVVHGLISPDS